MHEEISRILGMLEEGKVSAEEAERLIVAVREREGGGRRAPHRPDAAREIQEALRCFAKGIRQVARQQRRFAMWRFYEYLRWQEQQRREREAGMSVGERVRFLLRERVFADPEAIGSEARLVEDLRLGPLGRPLLRMSLENEFHMRIADTSFRELATVGDVERYVAERLVQAAAGPAPAPDEGEGAAPELGAESGAKRRGKPVRKSEEAADEGEAAPEA